MNIPSISGSSVIRIVSSTPPVVTLPPPKCRLGVFRTGSSSPPPDESNPWAPIVDSAVLLKPESGAATYAPHTPVVGVDWDSEAVEFGDPFIPPVDAVVKLLVVLTGSCAPLLIALDNPFDLEGLAS